MNVLHIYGNCSINFLYMLLLQNSFKSLYVELYFKIHFHTHSSNFLATVRSVNSCCIVLCSLLHHPGTSNPVPMTTKM